MDNPLSKILTSLSSVFKKEKTSKSVLGIDIGSSSIKIVQLRNKGGKAILETYGSISLGPYGKTDIGQITNLPVEILAQALADVVKESNVTTNNGAIAIPSSASLISLIPLPSGLSKEKMDLIIPTEARKYIPVPISEVTLDWWMLPVQAESLEEDGQNTVVSPESKTEVLIVAIHNDILAKYRDLLNRTNIISDFFEIEIFSSIRSVLSHELAPILIMDFGASKTKLSVIEYGIVKNFHVINRGSEDITKNISQSLNISFSEAEKLKREVGLDITKNSEVAKIAESSFNFIFSEANTVVLNFEKKYNKNISKVILSGGGALTKGLLEKTTANFNTEVVYGNSFGKTEAPAFLGGVLEKSGPEFAVAVGLALRRLQ